MEWHCPITCFRGVEWWSQATTKLAEGRVVTAPPNGRSDW